MDKLIISHLQSAPRRRPLTPSSRSLRRRSGRALPASPSISHYLPCGEVRPAHTSAPLDAPRSDGHPSAAAQRRTSQIRRITRFAMTHNTLTPSAWRRKRGEGGSRKEAGRRNQRAEKKLPSRSQNKLLVELKAAEKQSG